MLLTAAIVGPLVFVLNEFFPGEEGLPTTETGQPSALQPILNFIFGDLQNWSDFNLNAGRGITNVYASIFSGFSALVTANLHRLDLSLAEEKRMVLPLSCASPHEQRMSSSLEKKSNEKATSDSSPSIACRSVVSLVRQHLLGDIAGFFTSITDAKTSGTITMTSILTAVCLSEHTKENS